MYPVVVLRGGEAGGESHKNQTESVCAELYIEVSAQAPYGRGEEDKVSVYTQVGMGNMVSRTEYVYLWHAEGKAPIYNTNTDEKDSDEQKRKEEEKRLEEEKRIPEA